MWYTLFFLFLLKIIDFGYSLEPPRRGGSNEYPQSMFWAEIWKISEFSSENFQFVVMKFSIYLNRRVFIMISLCCIWLASRISATAADVCSEALSAEVSSTWCLRQQGLAGHRSRVLGRKCTLQPGIYSSYFFHFKLLVFIAADDITDWKACSSSTLNLVHSTEYIQQQRAAAYS